MSIGSRTTEKPTLIRTYTHKGWISKTSSPISSIVRSTTSATSPQARATYLRVKTLPVRSSDSRGKLLLLIRRVWLESGRQTPENIKTSWRLASRPSQARVSRLLQFSYPSKKFYYIISCPRVYIVCSARPTDGLDLKIKFSIRVQFVFIKV